MYPVRLKAQKRTSINRTLYISKHKIALELVAPCTSQSVKNAHKQQQTVRGSNIWLWKQSNNVTQAPINPSEQTELRRDDSKRVTRPLALISGRSKSACYPEKSVYLGEYHADVGSRLRCSCDGWLSLEAATPFSWTRQLLSHQSCQVLRETWFYSHDITDQKRKTFNHRKKKKSETRMTSSVLKQNLNT